MSPSLETVRIVYVTIPILSAIVGLFLAYWISANYRGRRDAVWFVYAVLGSVLWSLATVGHLVSSGWESQLFFRYVSEVAGLTALSLFPVFVSTYTGRNFHRQPACRLALAVIIGAGYAVIATSPLHSLLYSDVILRPEPFPHLVTTYGFGYAPSAILLLLLICYSSIELVRYLVSTARETGFQLVLFLLGSASMGVATLIGTTDLVPAAGLNHAVYGVLPFNVLVAIALFRVRLFDVQPVARNTIVENLSDPIVILDGRRRIVDYNREAARLWPTVIDRVGAPLSDLSSSLADGVDVPPSGQRETTQKLVLTVDGTTRHYSVTVTGIDRRGRDQTGWFAVLLRDVTDLERSLQQLTYQNERLDQVASTISHDLQNPIQVAGGYLELLETELDALASNRAVKGDAETVETARSHLEVVSGSIDRMAAIVTDVLVLAREGTTVEDTDPVEFGAAAREAWSNVETGSATLVVEADDDLRANRGRLLSILENCFSNAVEHGSPDGTVTVGLEAGEFYVADQGPGIPSAVVDEAFEYGFTTDEDGTGFGLSIVQTMAESHGWTVSVDRDYDDGARFVFDVTAAADPAVNR